MREDYYVCIECRELCNEKDVTIIHGQHRVTGTPTINIYCKKCWKKNYPEQEDSA